MEDCQNIYGNQYLLNETESKEIEKKILLNQRIELLKKKAKMDDANNYLYFLGVNNKKYVSDLNGNIIDIKKFNNETYKKYDYNNPYFPDQQIIISAKSLSN